MFDDRLPTKVWVDALLRRAQVAGASAFVLQRGEESRGDVLIKVADLQGSARAYVPRTGMLAGRRWVRPIPDFGYVFTMPRLQPALRTLAGSAKHAKR